MAAGTAGIGRTGAAVVVTRVARPGGDCEEVGGAGTPMSDGGGTSGSPTPDASWGCPGLPASGERKNNPQARAPARSTSTPATAATRRFEGADGATGAGCRPDSGGPPEEGGAVAPPPAGAGAADLRDGVCSGVAGGPGGETYATVPAGMADRV